MNEFKHMLNVKPFSITLLFQRRHIRWVFNVPGSAGRVGAVGSKQAKKYQMDFKREHDRVSFSFSKLSKAFETDPYNGNFSYRI